MRANFKALFLFYAQFSPLLADNLYFGVWMGENIGEGLYKESLSGTCVCGYRGGGYKEEEWHTRKYVSA